eukprot:TRINITY_DN11020_c0_g1_i1.p1 TRINITY_DN11020_c0_g1~~TRINITY_DN11020_c0_g1_i1.p1  ORF type:complete len:285 (+),score=65.22 TRINITY_DN11020_c0_g1_i1:80-856(+)
MRAGHPRGGGGEGVLLDADLLGCIAEYLTRADLVPLLELHSGVALGVVRHALLPRCKALAPEFAFVRDTEEILLPLTLCRPDLHEFPRTSPIYQLMWRGVSLWISPSTQLVPMKTLLCALCPRRLPKGPLHLNLCALRVGLFREISGMLSIGGIVCQVAAARCTSGSVCGTSRVSAVREACLEALHTVRLVNAYQPLDTPMPVTEEPAGPVLLEAAHRQQLSERQRKARCLLYRRSGLLGAQWDAINEQQRLWGDLHW